MGLRDIVIRTKTVTVQDQSFEVRGISMSDVMIAVSDYGPQLSLCFEQFRRGDIETTDIKAALLGLSREFPELLAAIICMASDDYDPALVKKVAKLPLSATTEALEAIFGLTFASEAEVKKFMESLTRMITAGSGALTTVRGPSSETGTGGSVAA